MEKNYTTCYGLEFLLKFYVEDLPSRVTGFEREGFKEVVNTK